MSTDVELGPFWRKKITTWVTRFDKDKDGVVSWGDFNRMADRYVKYGKPSPDKEKHARDTIQEIWKKYFEEASKTQSITADVYCDMLKALGKESIDATQNEFFSLLFDVVDPNRDGKLQPEEFLVFHKILGLKDEALTTETFLAINTAKDGAMSKDEFLVATKEFCVGNDELSPFRLLFGPLL